MDVCSQWHDDTVKLIVYINDILLYFSSLSQSLQLRIMKRDDELLYQSVWLQDLVVHAAQNCSIVTRSRSTGHVLKQVSEGTTCRPLHRIRLADYRLGACQATDILTRRVNLKALLPARNASVGKSVHTRSDVNFAWERRRRQTPTVSLPRCSQFFRRSLLALARFRLLQRGPKTQLPPNYQLIGFTSHEIRFFVELKCQTSTNRLLLLGIRALIRDVNYYAWAAH